MNNIQILANQAINRAKNLQEFIVFRDMDSLVFNGEPFPYTISHTMGMPVEITVPALTQEEAEQRVNNWLDRQRDPL
jgi:hypothetical protein